MKSSAFGGLLDHSIDALFVTVNLAALAAVGIVTALLAPLAITSFAQYVWDSKALSGAPLRASVLGRWNGIGYYVIVGIRDAPARTRGHLAYPCIDRVRRMAAGPVDADLDG